MFQYGIEDAIIQELNDIESLILLQLFTISKVSDNYDMSITSI